MFNFEIKKIINNRETIITSVFILICLILAVIFPTNDKIQGVTKGLFFFFIIPLLYIKIVLGKKLSEFGLNVKNKKAGIFWGSLMLAISLTSIYLAVNYFDFLENYSLPFSAIENFWAFSFYVIIFSNAILFFQEYFFRGFILSFFLNKIGIWSVVFQAGLYFLAIAIALGGFSKEMWQFTPYFILSITGGVVAYKSRSMIYSWISGLLFLIIANSYIIYIIKR